MDKKLSVLAILLCLAFASLAAVPRLKAASTTLSLNPATTMATLPGNPGIHLGETFNVTLYVSNVTNLWSWKVSLNWDPKVLNMISAPTEGTFMGGVTLFLANTANYTNGNIPEVSDTYLSTTGKSGSGLLATFTFEIVGFSPHASVISISNAIMLDPSMPHNHIAFTTTNAIFYLPGPVRGGGPGSSARILRTLSSV